MLEDDVAQCVRLEIDPVCRALTRADPVHCLGEEECLAEVRLLTALKGKGSCSSIQGATGNLMCIAVSTRDEAKCSTLAQPIRTECLAVVQNAPAQCDNLKKEERANCRNTWAMVRSLLQNDAKLCAHLPDYDPEKKSPHSMRRFCLAVAAMAPSRCEMDLKNYCRRRISLKHLTRHSCHVLQNALLRQRCKEIHGR